MGAEGDDNSLGQENGLREALREKEFSPEKRRHEEHWRTVDCGTLILLRTHVNLHTVSC